MKTSFLSKLDQIGFTTSALCAVHCALMPFIVTTLPLIGLEFLSNPWVELTVIALSVVIGISSLVPSYLKFHRKFSPIFVLLLGFSLIFGTHLLGLHNMEPVLVPLGGLAIAAAHFLNWKLTKLYGHICDTASENKQVL